MDEIDPFFRKKIDMVEDLNKKDTTVAIKQYHEEVVERKEKAGKKKIV